MSAASRPFHLGGLSGFLLSVSLQYSRVSWSAFPLVLFILVGSVPDSACIYLNLLPGIKPLLVHSQLRLCLDRIIVINAFPLFCLSICVSRCFVTVSLLLLIFCRFNLTNLSSFKEIACVTRYLVRRCFHFCWCLASGYHCSGQQIWYVAAISMMDSGCALTYFLISR